MAEKYSQGRANEAAYKYTRHDHFNDVCRVHVESRAECRTERTHDPLNSPSEQLETFQSAGWNVQEIFPGISWNFFVIFMRR